MKKQTVNDRIIYLREVVLKTTREKFCEYAGISRSTGINIENDPPENRERAINEVIENLRLNSEWVWSGKAPIFATGTDAENVARIKAGNNSHSINPLESEVYKQQQARIDELTRDKNFFKAIIEQALGKGKLSFKPAPDHGSYPAMQA